MSAAAAPWSVKGIEPKAREIAKDLARRSGMTLGEWLNTMIMEDGDDEGVVPLSRRPHAADSFDRRGRARRMDDVYGADADGGDRGRLDASIDAIAARLEAAERRSTVAIQGVDQAVSGLVRRLEGQDHAGRQYARRIDDIAEELREGHRRLRKFEQDTGPRTTETFGKVETALGALAGRLYDIEERQRSGVNELRQRMDVVEKVAGPGAGPDLLAQVGARLDQAQAGTTEALRALERSFADLDQRLRAAEGRVEPEGVREAARFEKLAETLSRQVDANRVEMMRRLDTAETEGRMDRIERAVLAIGDQLKTSEDRSARAVEAMGREVLRIAQNLNGRVQKIEVEAPARLEQLGQTLALKVEGDMGRFAQGLEQRLVAADDRHALALEKLGGEITRISDRLSERIAQSERRSAQALEDIGRRLNDSSSRIEQHYDRASGELAERMRMSEERTAALIAEARSNIERRAEPAREAPVIEPDWRAAAFPDIAFPDAPFTGAAFDDPIYAEQQAWSADLAPPEPVAAPVPAMTPAPEAFLDEPFAPEPARALAADAMFDAVARAPTPFGSRPAEPVTAPAAEAVAPEPVAPDFSAGFGGADVSDALEATAPDAFDRHEDFAGETDFVDPRALRAAAQAGRASSTRQTIDAARAAMTTPAAAEAPVRQGFGLKRGGKSRLQERLDKQASRDGGTVRKALGASAVAVILTGGAIAAYGQLTGTGVPGFPSSTPAVAAPLAALAIVPADATPAADVRRAATLYQQSLDQLEASEPTALATLTQAAELGSIPAQLRLVGIYQDGSNGVTADPVQARAWARRAAEGDDPKGMHVYAMYLYDGVGGEHDRTGALLWLKKAAGRGLVDSQYNIGRLYENGEEAIARNLPEAYKWYLIAARAGDDDSRAAAERVKTELTPADRDAARAAANAFQVEPLA